MLPELLEIPEIHARLAVIFPEGTPQRGYLIREMAARVVFVLLYTGAIEGTERWLGPKHVYAMSDEQAQQQSDEAREAYCAKGWRAGYEPRGSRWYADTTREPLRDETLRDGLVRIGAVIQRQDIPTTSSKPRYALQQDFARLFDPQVSKEAFEAAAHLWRATFLNPMTLARLALLRQGAAAAAGTVSVLLPNGTLRQLSPGPSSVIAKAVVEVFAPTFLNTPAVLLLSESGNKIVAQEEGLTRAVGLEIDVSTLLPDIILFDLAPRAELLVFVEVVATDGPISEARKQALLAMAQSAQLPASQILFVTAYLDRSQPAFKKTVDSIAWNTLVWFASEPDHLIVFRDHTERAVGLRDLLG